jgi:hypothetical protein
VSLSPQNQEQENAEKRVRQKNTKHVGPQTEKREKKKKKKKKKG